MIFIYKMTKNLQFCRKWLKIPIFLKKTPSVQELIIKVALWICTQNCNCFNLKGILCEKSQCVATSLLWTCLVTALCQFVGHERRLLFLGQETFWSYVCMYLSMFFCFLAKGYITSFGQFNHSIQSVFLSRKELFWQCRQAW